MTSAIKARHQSPSGHRVHNDGYEALSLLYTIDGRRQRLKKTAAQKEELGVGDFLKGLFLQMIKIELHEDLFVFCSAGVIFKRNLVVRMDEQDILLMSYMSSQ